MLCRSVNGDRDGSCGSASSTSWGWLQRFGMAAAIAACPPPSACGQRGRYPWKAVEDLVGDLGEQSELILHRVRAGRVFSEQHRALRLGRANDPNLLAQL